MSIREYLSDAWRVRAEAMRISAGGRGTVIWFVLLYKLVFALVAAPLGRLVWTGALLLSPAHYITGANMGQVLRSPLIWLALLILAIGFAFWALLEVSAIITCLDCVYQQHRIGLFALVRRSIRNIRAVLLPKNWPLLLFAAVVVPFTNLFMTSDFISQLVVPEYIMQVINATPLYHALYWAVMALLIVWTLEWLFVFHYFVLEHCSLAQAACRSARLVRRRRIRSAALIFWRRIAVSVKLVLVILPALLGLGILLFAWNSASLSSAVMVATQYVFSPVLALFADCLTTLARYGCLAVLYREYKKQDGEPAPELPVRARPRAPKKRLAAALGLILGAAVLGGGILGGTYLLVDQTDFLDTLTAETIAVTSHRGYSAIAPENTLPAFQAAIDCGKSEYAELDVQLTADGVVVVSHDTSLLRCTGVDKNIPDLTWSEIEPLEATRSYTGADRAKFAGTGVPTLAEVLELCDGKIKLNIEIKGNSPGLEEATVKVIRDHDFADQCVITSLRYEALEKVKETAPELTCGYIMAMGVGNYYDLPAADFFSVETTFISDNMVTALHARGKQVHAWTVDQDDDANRMIALHVDNIITNAPEAIYQDIQSVRDLPYALTVLPDESPDAADDEQPEDLDELLNEV